MKNKKLLIVFVVLLVLITSFLLFILKPNTNNKKLKELNYNVTYKEAFPDENLRRGVLLCIMRNKCGEDQYNSGAYDYNIYKEHMEDANYIKKYYETKDYQENPDFGAIITEEQLEQKEKEKISKEDLDKLRVLIPYNNKNIVETLEGVEYLSNLKAAIPGKIGLSNIDFSYNKNLEVIYFNQYTYFLLVYITNITFPQNNKIKHIIGNKYEGNLDLSDFKFLETFEMINARIRNIILPKSLKILNLEDSAITAVNLTNLVNLEKLNLKDTYITTIDLSKLLKLKTVSLSIQYLNNNIDFTNNPNLETVELFGESPSVKRNKQIDFSKNINLKTLKVLRNKIKTLDLKNNVNLNTIIVYESDLESLNLENNIKLEKLDLSRNNITELDISKNINLKELIVKSNKISNLKLTGEKIEKLDLSYNKYLKSIDIKNLKNLKYINLNYTMLKEDTIDFSHNLNLEEVYIEGDDIKIDNLDFSNNPDLKVLNVLSRLKTLNIEKNISLNSNNLKINDNHITKIKFPTTLNNNTYQTINLKVKKDSDVEIPVYLNNEKLYISDQSYFTRQGDKYRFNEVGIYKEEILKRINAFSYHLNINIEVTEDDVDFVPSIVNQREAEYMPLINEEIKVDDIKRIIKNLPNDIKSFEIISPNPVKFEKKGKNILKIKIVFNDNKTKTFDIPIDVYEPKYLYFTFDHEFNGEPKKSDFSENSDGSNKKYYLPCGVNLIERKNIEYIRNRYINHCPCYDDYINFIRTEEVKPISYEYFDLPKGLSGGFDGVFGKIDYEFKEGEKEHVFYIKYKEIGHVYTMEETIKIKLLRDRDFDGIPDINDDDVDGDGFTDIEELAKGSNPYDKNSTPNNVINALQETEAAKFKPIIEQKDYKPLFNDKITREEIKKVITNLPVDIKNLEVLRIFRSNTSEYTKIKVAISITFKDNSKKEFDIPINIYKEEFLTPKLEIENKTILEGKKLDIDILKKYDKEEYIDDNNFIKYVKDKSEYYIYNENNLGLPNGLAYNSNSVTGVIDYNFYEDQEEQKFDIYYLEKFNHNDLNNRFSITLLRDTDKDGIPDKDDDDKDGDGVSNDIEIANGSDQYNKNIIPGMSKKEVLDVLVNDLEKLINDSKNNKFENKNKLDVDNFKEVKLHYAIELLKETKESYNNTTLDDDIEKLIKKVRAEIDYLKEQLNYVKDKANFDQLDKELSKVIEKKDYYDEESYEEYKNKIEEAKNLNRDTATQFTEVDQLLINLVDKRKSLKLDKTKFLNQIEEINEKLSNVKCIDNECSYIKDKISELYNESLSCKYLTIEEIKEIINKANKLLKNYKFTNPNTGIKTYSLVILLIIFISYLVFKKKKSYIR